MKGFARLVAGGAACAAGAVATPALAQYYTGSPYGAPADPRSYDYAPPGEGVSRAGAIDRCVAATQERLDGRYPGYGDGEFAQPRGRVLGISGVEPRAGGGVVVRGVARTVEYRAYGYPSQAPNLVWTCRTDFRGFVIGLHVQRARPNVGYDYHPWDNDYSQYGYQRY